MKLNKKSFKLTVSIVCAFVLLAVCARVTERALPASAQTGEKPVSAHIESVIVGNGEHIYPKLRHIVAQCRGTVEPWICGRLIFVIADKGLLI